MPPTRHQQTAFLIIDLCTRSLVIAGTIAILVLASDAQRRASLIFVRAYIFSSLLLTLSLAISLRNILLLVPPRSSPSLPSSNPFPSSSATAPLVPVASPLSTSSHPILPAPAYAVNASPPEYKPYRRPLTASPEPPQSSVSGALCVVVLDFFGCALALLGLFFTLLADQNQSMYQASSSKTDTDEVVDPHDTLHDETQWVGGWWQVRIYILFGLLAAVQFALSVSNCFGFCMHTPTSKTRRRREMMQRQTV